jgi:hypothetical protein
MARLKALPKIGDIVVVKANSNDHNYTIGKQYRVVAYSVCDAVKIIRPFSFIAESLNGKWKGNHLNYRDCDPVLVGKAVIEAKIESLNEKIDKLQAEIKHNQSIIAWMDETGADSYDENEHKVWQTLTTIENGSMSKMEKVKAIAALLK